MKKLYWSLALLAVVLSVGAYMYTTGGWNCCNSTDCSAVQASDEQDAQETYAAYLNKLRSNVVTGKIEDADIRNARLEIAKLDRAYKATFPLNWVPAGPDNIGGRSRAMVIDRNDNNILYVGGVNGGVFKSTNKGNSWKPLGDDMSSMAIGSMCQDKNGNIYVGTGEGFTSPSGGETYTPGFPGDGIFISTDGSTFTKLTTSSIFNYVFRMVAHPSKDEVYAATNLGLYYSTDQGKKWTVAKAGACTDIVMDKNGNMLGVFSNRVYRSTNPTDGTSYKLADGVTIGSRIVLAVSESDPNYAYAMVTGSTTIEAPSGNVPVGAGLIGVFQSKDNGQTFGRIIGKENVYFNLMSHIRLGSGQGIYNSCIGVHPQNPERIFMGGIEFGEWTPELGPRIVGNTGDHPSNRTGIHADKHFITFDTKSDPIIMYILSDGGVSKTTNAALNNYAGINIGYQTTQFFGMDVEENGIFIGGTQDQSTIMVDGKGSTKEAGYEILGGDGGRCEISAINPQVMFGQLPRGDMFRSNNSGGGWSDIWDARINEYFVDPDDPESDTDPVIVSNQFNGALRLWENRKTGENRLFFSLNSTLWMAYDVINEPNPIWYKIADLGTAADQVEASEDGNTLFLGGGSGRVWRLDGLNKVQWDTTGPLADLNKIPDSLRLTSIQGGGMPGAFVSDIEIDYNNPDRVIVTFAQYGVSNRVFVTENANAPSPTFRSIDGVLPNMPIYDVEISWENPNHIFLGTEFGVWSTQNGMATTPLWIRDNNGFANVAVFEMKQSEIIRETWRTGPVLYAATHGRGIFKSENLLTSAKRPSIAPIKLTAYPNPVLDFVNLDFRAIQSDLVQIQVVDLNGRVYINRNEKVEMGDAHLELDMRNLPAATYFVRVKGQHHGTSAKLVKLQ
jgi:hypothetical protein